MTLSFCLRGPERLRFGNLTQYTNNAVLSLLSLDNSHSSYPIEFFEELIFSDPT
jgi:hypothetical protein